MDQYEYMFNHMLQTDDVVGLEHLIRILKRKLPMPNEGLVINDPLRGMDRAPSAPSQNLPLAEPWKLRLGNRINLSLPAPRGAEFGIYGDIETSPIRLLGGGAFYKQSF